MALSGSLSEFSIPEVLQLLALQQKSGVLSLNHEDGRKHHMYFERGYVIAAAEANKVKDSEFLQALHDCLHLSKEQVQTVADIAGETNQDLLTVLLTTGVLGRDRLTEEMHRFAQYKMDEIVGWRAGTYEFSGDEKSVPSVGLVHKVSTEELLMESMRRNDELMTLKESIISEDQILAKSSNPPSQPLPRECQIVLRLITGQRTVQEICGLSPLGDWPTYDAISELLGHQQVIVLDHDTASMLLSRQSRFAISPLAWIALLAPLTLSVLLGTFFNPLFVSNATGWLPEDLQERRVELRQTLEEEALDIRRANHQD